MKENGQLDIDEKYDKDQISLFPELEHDWRKEWDNMPEFHQIDLMPWKTLYVHFSSEQDMQEFAKLLGQDIYESTRFVWFPKAEKAVAANKKWVDEDAP